MVHGKQYSGKHNHSRFDIIRDTPQSSSSMVSGKKEPHEYIIINNTRHSVVVSLAMPYHAPWQHFCEYFSIHHGLFFSHRSFEDDEIHSNTLQTESTTEWLYAEIVMPNSKHNNKDDE